MYKLFSLYKIKEKEMSSVNVLGLTPLSNFNELNQIEKNIETGKAKKTIPLVAEDKIKSNGDDVKLSVEEKEIKSEEKGFFQKVGEAFKQCGNDIANAKTFKDKVGVFLMGKPLYEADVSNAQKARALCSPSYASSLFRAKSAPSVTTTAMKGQTAPSGIITATKGQIDPVDYLMPEKLVSATFGAIGLGAVMKNSKIKDAVMNVSEAIKAEMEATDKNNKIEE